MSKKSTRGLGALFFALCFVSAESVAEERARAPIKAEVGIAAMHFKYDEFNNNGRILDTEQGVISGVSLKVGQKISAWEWQGSASYYRGRIAYDGQTNLGAPYRTRTDEAISDMALRLGYWVGEHPLWMPYIGLGYRRWDRDILPNTLNGLFESYRWQYVWLGAKFIALQKGQSHYLLDVGLLQPLDPMVYVDFKGTYNVSPIVYPQSNTGLRMMFTANHALSANTELTVEPYFEYWELGRSPTVIGGGIAVNEPASKTNNFGLNLRLARKFD
jgi:hypothetical protein